MKESRQPAGPLAGVRIIEIAGLGAAPFCGMLLADMGAEIVRVDRLGGSAGPHPETDPLSRSRKSIAVNLKDPRGVDILLRLIDTADALFEGFRPGVAERLGFGPEVCLARNPRLVYGRLTGWGQEGPLAKVAGHDINYIALSGALHAIGSRGGKPVPPMNLVGDFGGGGMLLAFGLVCALLEAQRSGQGQVIDAAMLDGALAQMAMSFGMQAAGLFSGQPGADLLSGAAPYYDTYETADGKYVAIGALEPQFFRQLLEALDIDPAGFADAGYRGVTNPTNTGKWPALRALLEQAFRTKTRDQWCALMEGTDICFAPVLSLSEVGDHRHNRARQAVIDIAGVAQNAPAPRFSRTPAVSPTPPPEHGAHTDEILLAAEFTREEIHELREQGVIG
jgi:alpha-methylacyl-CoA racemase